MAIINEILWYVLWFVTWFILCGMCVETFRSILLLIKLKMEATDTHAWGSVFNFYRCSNCGYECRFDDWPKNGKHCPECMYSALNIVPTFKITHRRMEEVTDLICETCEIPLRMAYGEIYCPYCREHNPYKLYVKGDDSEPVIARKVHVADELKDAIIKICD